MPRKTIIIFIIVFILIMGLFFGVYEYLKPKGASTQPAGSTGTGYLPFTLSNNGTTAPTGGNTDNTNTGQSVPTSTQQATTSTSKFHQLTTFSVAGAAFLEDIRPIPPAVTDSTTTAAATAPQATDSATLSTATSTPPAVPEKKTTKTTPKAPPQAFENVPSLRYIERVTGHIDEMFLDTKAVSIISNTTIPAIYEGIFDSKASTVIYRYLDSDNATIDSFMATLGGAQGEFLPSNILDVSVSTDRTKFFYLTQTPNGVTGTVRAFGSTKKTQVFTSPFVEWLSQWAGNNIYLTTKASYASPGDLYSLNPTSGTLVKLLGPVEGLTTLANSTGTLVLYSTSNTNGPDLSLFNVATHASADLDLASLPEKCVWSADNVTIYCAIPNNISGQEYPDSWYQGITSFNDAFVKIDTSTMEQSTIADSNNGTPVDGTHLFLDDKESELFFINKKDSTLWELDLN